MVPSSASPSTRLTFFEREEGVAVSFSFFAAGLALPFLVCGLAFAVDSLEALRVGLAVDARVAGVVFTGDSPFGPRASRRSRRGFVSAGTKTLNQECQSRAANQYGPPRTHRDLCTAIVAFEDELDDLLRRP